MPRDGSVRRGASVPLRAGVGILSLGAAGVAAWALWMMRPHAPRESEPAPPRAVQVMRVAPVPVARRWEGYGTARAMNRAEVSSEVRGRIVERPERIEAGVAVEAGEVLLRLDDADYRQRVAAAEQALAQWRADLAAWDIEKARLAEQVDLLTAEVGVQEREYRRAADMLERAGANITEVELRLVALTRAQRELAAQRQALELMEPRRARLLAQVAADEAALGLAQEDLRRTVIASPIAGTLQSVRGEVGELLSPGDPVAVVVDGSRLEVPLRVPVSAAGAVRVGDPVTLRADTRAGASVPGRVARIAPESDPQTRTLTVFVEVEQRAGGEGGPRPILPGQFLVATLESAQAQPRALVPRGAVDGERVLAVRDEGGVPRVLSLPVRVAHHLDAPFPALVPGETQWAVVESGLEPGTLVVVGDLSALVPGMEVRAVPVGAGASARDGEGGAPAAAEKGAGG